MPPQSDRAQVHATAVVDEGAQLGPGTKVWHFCHVTRGARVGARCVLGQNVFVGRDVTIGEGTKIQNNVSVYEGVRVGRRCVLGPSAVFTNVKTPRAEVERKGLYEPTVLEDGVTIGANATVVCGVTIGRYAVVGAGSVVTSDVAPHRVVYGVPARARGWACLCGAVLGARLSCAECRRSYRREGPSIAEARGARARGKPRR
jgi:UDP-2-acetamido-3-amino-2,3-dideoxy-glucuronate N-acetyltransferase